MRVVDILKKNMETWNGWHTRKSMWPVLHTEISVPVSFAGTISMPTLFGLIVDYISVSLLPVFILGLLLLISVMHELVTKRKIISSNMAKLGDELM